ncbi:MAG: phospho-N-acetylmuramoyl-pentapeptide-transferase [Clostridiales bacterium]|nr:phospho-N-acetylmuramoyl-pentapeptide-transferase [Clostridiales bacterium]MBQ3322529.1 phospho-N-acetylmuramoyl-pentapeptide-transferase [Bacillota bacterium]
MNIHAIHILIIIVSAFAISVVLTEIEIPFLRRKAGQNIREEGLKSHYSKAGTPSMGGISIIFATCAMALIGTLAFGGTIGDELLILLVFVGYGMIGFVDDYRKVIKKQNEGLTAKQKFAMQMIIAIAFAIFFAHYSAFGTSVYIPVFNIFVEFGYMYYVFVAFAVLAMTNAVNLTDGLDGLASGVTTLVALFFAYAGFMGGAFIKYGAFIGNASETYFFAALAGGCLGFLVFNRNPARVFMGDTGSLALGGGVVAAAIVMKLELLLLVAGLVYVIEALSVVLQVTYFKLSHGKRIFKMAPIHHHFEMCGMKERQVVGMFWTFTLVCCAAAALML